MEKAWKIINLFIALVLIGLCSGFPIGLENSAADYHTQFLTGLVGVLLTVCGVVFLVGCLCCQRKNGFKEFHNNPVVASSTSSLDHGHINPIANGEFTIFTPLSPPHHNNNVFLANEQIVGQTEIDYNHADIDVHSWFDGTESDFPRTKLKYIKELGKGWFGRVVEGTAQGLNGNDDEQSWSPVAVRILEASATSTERAVFLHDATIYRCGKHPHILKLLGRSLESVPLLLLQELCPRGDLKKYLRDNRGTAEKLLSSDLPLLWCCQLSSALKHLHDHRLTHPDLATRNCQVVSDLSLKLGDYGLAASLYPEDYYQGAPAVPVRWCAPESLTYTSTTIQPKQITFEGNVWSLGVTMWEIYECGAQPYTYLTDDDVISQVLGSTNVRLSRPEFSILYTDYIFRLMQLCWSTSESRPSVSQVHLMLTDLMQVYENTKHITHHSADEPLISLQDFDKRWDNFKPNSVARTDNHDFIQDNMSMADIDLSDITVLNMNLGKEELSSTKPMSPSLNNLHGSLDNLGVASEMDSWLQKVATKTGDMSYVRGLSEAIKDLDNTLALENVSSSDSSHQPSPAPENLPKINGKLEFKLGPTDKSSNDVNKTQNSSLTESVQRTSSESETEDENWRRKIERGAYSEKVQQKSKSVTDLMILTHIDCSESDSETPLPSLDYRVNYRNVRYAPKQNLENVSLMFGSEGNLLSVHDKFQEELRRLQGERKDSLLFVPESVSHSGGEKPDKSNKYRTGEPPRGAEFSSSDEETWTVRQNQDANCTYVNTNASASLEPQENLNLNSKNHQNPDLEHQENMHLNSKNVSPNNRNPEALIEELSSPTDIQPGNQVYNIFNVTVDANFSPMHLRSNLNEIICYNEPESDLGSRDEKDCSSGAVVVKKDFAALTPCFQVPKLTELIQNNDDLMDYIIAKYDETQEDANLKTDISEVTKTDSTNKELNNNIQNAIETSKNIQTATRKFLQKEQQSCEVPKVHFDVSVTQEKVLPTTMTHSSLFTSTPHTNRTNYLHERDNCELEGKTLQFSSNFADLSEEADKSELKYSLETWDNFLGKAFDGSRECSGFDEFLSEPRSLLFVDDRETIQCKNGPLIDSFRVEEAQQNETVTLAKTDEAPSVLQPENTNETFICQEVADINNVTVVLKNKEEQLNGTYTMQPETSSSSSNWEPGEGWFLHPQTEVSGQMEVSQSGDTESYVGFSMDDEIMAAIRNELLMKLPQAQGQSSEQIKDSDEWDSEGRSEVLIKYNVYTTPLSPIPEESYSENDSHHFIYNREDSSDSENGDWPEPYEEHNSGLGDTETRSMQNAESPIQEPQNRHTPSQDSCCSNDTLFNLEDLTYAINENESLKICGDLTEKKSYDLFDVEECTLKAVENEIPEVATENAKNIEVLSENLEGENIKKDNVVLKKTNMLKTEVFTCNIEPTNEQVEELLTLQENTKEFTLSDEIFIQINDELKNTVKNFITYEKGELLEDEINKNYSQINNSVLEGENKIKTTNTVEIPCKRVINKIQEEGFSNANKNFLQTERQSNTDDLESEVIVTEINKDEISTAKPEDVLETKNTTNRIKVVHKTEVNAFKSEAKPENPENSKTNIQENENLEYQSDTNFHKNEINVKELEKHEVDVPKFDVIVIQDEVIATQNNINALHIKDLGKEKVGGEEGEVKAYKIEVVQKEPENKEKYEVDATEIDSIATRGEVTAIQFEVDTFNENDEVGDDKGEGRTNKIEVALNELENLKEYKVDVLETDVTTRQGKVNIIQNELSDLKSNDLKEDEVAGIAYKTEEPENEGKYEVDAPKTDSIATQDEVTAIQNELNVINEKDEEVGDDKGEGKTNKTEVALNELENFKEYKTDVTARQSEVNMIQNELNILKSNYLKEDKVEDEGKAYKTEVAMKEFEILKRYDVDTPETDVIAPQNEVNILKDEVSETVAKQQEVHTQHTDLEDLKLHEADVQETVKQDEVISNNEIDLRNLEDSKKDEIVGLEGEIISQSNEDIASKSQMTVEKLDNKHEVVLCESEFSCNKSTCEDDVKENELRIKESVGTAKQNEVVTTRGDTNIIKSEINTEEIGNLVEVAHETDEEAITKQFEANGFDIKECKHLEESEVKILSRGAITASQNVSVNLPELINTQQHEVSTPKAIIALQQFLVNERGGGGLSHDKDEVNIKKPAAENRMFMEEYKNTDQLKVTLENYNLHLDTSCRVKKNNDDMRKGECETTDEEKTKTEKNDSNINKLNIKNIQNGIVPGNSPMWINDIKNRNENDVNLINVLGNLSDNDVNVKFTENPQLLNSEIVPDASTAETKEKGTDISLLVENNPNCIAEFLNHERCSGISNFDTSRNLNVNDRDYVNLDDISVKLVGDAQPTGSADYVSTNELLDLSADIPLQPEYVNIVKDDELDAHLYDPVANDGADLDVYDALTDIRFTGPTDIQLMSTSFSESADIDEQDWDSGSDTRSSSSGEFIWKEGEHEESVKALRAAPQDAIATEKIAPMEDIEEVTSESSDEDEEADSPEFVPSAWDKYATPTKSALRSPEKTLEKAEVKHKKPKGVWFKKQKYHCVYEYPREPESPIVNTYELWQPVSTSLIDWEVDTSPYVPSFDGTDSHPECYQQLDKHARNLYHLTDFTSGMTALDDEFFISSTTRPFESFGGLSSQFFPGQTTTDQWMDLTRQPNENITPDSGVEDITPASNTDSNEFLQTSSKPQVQPLKLLAAAALKHNQLNDLKSNQKDSLGGLRHARNKLKLDLPPSPSAFTSTKAFTIEPPDEPVTKREVPTFTTFGKSRFLVQHVDTPTCDEENESKNVSFEALPYKPIQTKVEVVRGEASLLDSADEDSGIESSTLERKKITNTAD